MNPETTYFTSDLHLGHKNILKFCPNRVFETIEDMDNDFINKINALPDGSTMYHLGDFCFENRTITSNYLGRIKKTLDLKFIFGNHDYAFLKNADWFSNNFDNIEMIGHYKEIRLLNKIKLILFHYPIASYNGLHHDSIHFYGHCHGNFKNVHKLSMDVGIDCTDLQILNFEQLADKLL